MFGPFSEDEKSPGVANKPLSSPCTEDKATSKIMTKIPHMDEIVQSIESGSELTDQSPASESDESDKSTEDKVKPLPNLRKRKHDTKDESAEPVRQALDSSPSPPPLQQRRSQRSTKQEPRTAAPAPAPAPAPQRVLRDRKKPSGPDSAAVYKAKTSTASKSSKKATAPAPEAKKVTAPAPRTKKAPATAKIKTTAKKVARGKKAVVDSDPDL